MPAATGLNDSLLGLLHQEVPQVHWVVLVGPLPPGQELELITAATGTLSATDGSSKPVLMVEPNPLRLQALQLDLEGAQLPALSLVSALLAAETGEQCWYGYNDSRFNGTTPPEPLQRQRPNLQLLNLELRPAQPLAAILEQWQPPSKEPPSQGNGLLLVGATAAAACLQGAGSWLSRLTTVLVASPLDEPNELEPLLTAGCLDLEASTPAVQLWRRSDLRVAERRLQALEQEHTTLKEVQEQLISERDGLVATRDQLTAERDQLTAERNQLTSERDGLISERDGLVATRDQLTAERDQLTAERNQLTAHKEDLEQKLAMVNTEVDEILALLDAAELEPQSAPDLVPQPDPEAEPGNQPAG